MILLLFAGCALRRIPHYSPDDCRVEPYGGDDDPTLPARIEAAIGRRHLRALDTGGVPIEQVPAEVLTAIEQCSPYTWARGAEFDLLVPDDEGTMAVQLRFSPRSELDARWARAAPARGELPADRTVEDWTTDLMVHYGLARFGGVVAWLPEEVADIELALALLNDRELEALVGVAFERVPESPRSSRELAYFDPRRKPTTISFYDPAFEPDGSSFSGQPDAPIAYGVTTALHEFAHVLVDAPLRRAHRAYLDAWARWKALENTPAAGVLWDEAVEKNRAYHALGDGPVIAAWVAFRGKRPGPTPYGWREPNESFAEAFAMYHADPVALDRALPGAVEWFESGEYLDAAGLGMGLDPDRPEN